MFVICRGSVPVKDLLVCSRLLYNNLFVLNDIKQCWCKWCFCVASFSLSLISLDVSCLFAEHNVKMGCCRR